MVGSDSERQVVGSDAERQAKSFLPYMLWQLMKKIDNEVTTVAKW